MRSQVEHVPILWNRDEQGISGTQGIGEPPLLNERSYAPDFARDRAGVGNFAHRPKVTRQRPGERMPGGRSVELVPELHPDNAWPQRRLGDDELIGADEDALV